MMDQINLHCTASSSGASNKDANRGDQNPVLKKYYNIDKPKNHTLREYLARRSWRPYRYCDAIQIARNHLPFLKQMDQMKKLPVHDGCVNTISWNKSGEYILSGSDDCCLCITKPLYLFDTSKDYTVLHKISTHHLGNIFSARFLPNSGDTKIASCCSRGLVKVHDIYGPDPGAGMMNFNCHSSTVYDVVTVPDNYNIFLTCAEDKTVRLFDMRVHSNCSRADTCPHPSLIRNSHAMTTLNLNPLNSNLMLIGRADGVGLVYDRRKLPNVAKFSREAAHAERLAGRDTLTSSFKYKHPMDGVIGQFQVPDLDSRYRFTSLCYNHDGTQVLASYSGEYLYLFNHDTSSNIELIQTLPKNKPSPTAADDMGVGNDSSTTHQTHGSSSSSSSTSNSNQRRTRISRIRVRGDWSDTGVNSMPHSRSATNPQTAATFLEHVAISLRSRHNAGDESGSLRDIIPVTEIIVGPISYESSSSNSERSQSSSSRSTSAERNMSEWELNANDESSDDDGGDDNNEEINTVIDYNQSDTTSDGVDHENIDGNKDSLESGGERVDDNQTSAIKRPSISESNRRKRISSSTRAKFRKTVEGLKDRYSQIPSYRPKVKYQGHRNSRTSIKEAIFWGDKFVMSGSDCGRIMVWHKDSAEMIMAFQADERVVNCLAPNPCQYVLASSGIDYDIKLWSTQSLNEGPLLVSPKVMSNIVENNEIMLEESKNTFSVPPHLFFRVLASLTRS